MFNHAQKWFNENPLDLQIYEPETVGKQHHLAHMAAVQYVLDKLISTTDSPTFQTFQSSSVQAPLRQ